MLKCSNCNSTNVETLAWVNLNGERKIQSFLSDSSEPRDNWCPDCETHCKIIGE